MVALCLVACARGAGDGAPSRRDASSPSEPRASRGAMAARPGPVVLRYLGNSCTLLIAPDGTRIVSDPYADDLHPAGLLPLPRDLQADAVTVSHAHRDHSAASAVGGLPRLIDRPGSYQVGMVRVTGYGGFEGSPSGPSHNAHTVFVFEIGGVKIVHLGDSGPVTAPDALAALANADVVLVNIDGYVFPLDRVLPWMRRIGARTVIPTHYSLRTDARWGTPETLTIEEYLATLPTGVSAVRMGSEIGVTAGMPGQVAALTPLMLER